VTRSATGKEGFSLPELLAVLSLGASLLALISTGVLTLRDRAETARCAVNLRQLHAANTLYAADHRYYVAAAADIAGANQTRWHGVRPSRTAAFAGGEGPLAAYLGGDGEVRRCGSLAAAESPYAFERSSGGYGYNARGIGSRVYVDTGRRAHERGMRPGEIRNPAQTVMFTDAAFPQPYQRPDHLIEYSFAEAYYFISRNRDGTLRESGPSTPSIHFRHLGRANVLWTDGRVTQEPPGTAHSDVFTAMNVGWLGGRNNDLFAPF
jgi:prepilin-type N-terminal cleavage/methylation domain-containing protein/prepilin-type processing-associated H-X9-DG protein